jgi:hypothetical protein
VERNVATRIERRFPSIKRDREKERGILTEAGQLVGVRGVNHIHEGLQLELASRHVLIVIHHRELEGGLHFVGTLLENSTCKQKTGSSDTCAYDADSEFSTFARLPLFGFLYS